MRDVLFGVELREDIGVAFETVRDWLLLLERFFYLFRLPPFTGRLARTLRKETKAYLYDWGEIPDEAIRFENLVALHLLKAVRLWKARGEADLSLHYIRDRQKREVDFVLVDQNKPICLVECTLSETQLAPSLSYVQQRLRVPSAVQLVRTTGLCRKIKTGGLTQWIVSADRWLAGLP